MSALMDREASRLLALVVAGAVCSGDFECRDLDGGG